MKYPSLRSILLALALAALSLVGCEECDDGDGRCKGDVVQICEDGAWVDETDCDEFDNETVEVYCFVDEEGPKCGSYEKIDHDAGS